MSPSLRFRGQPFRDEDTAGTFLATTLADPEVESLTIVVAWARFGGLRRFKSELEAFRAGGGRLEIVLGIDEEVATRPGLRLAIMLADRAHVFHDRGVRTFHPKLYLAEGPSAASLLVGSSNLTAGGLFSNYEASLEAEFQLPDEAEDPALVGAREYVATLLGDEELCRPLDGELLERLVGDPRYGISRGERRRQRSAPPPREGSEGGEVGQGADSEEIFGTSRNAKAFVPGLSATARQELDALEAEVAAEEPATPPTVVETWTKDPLPASDAQHPPKASSHPLGNVRLTKSRNPHVTSTQTWFRRVMFDGEEWVSGFDERGHPNETAIVPFSVTIDGRSHGWVDLEVSHAPHREEGQSNVVTVLHWGPLATVLRATDYTGRALTIQRMSDGTYRLDISR